MQPEKMSKGAPKWKDEGSAQEKDTGMNKGKDEGKANESTNKKTKEWTKYQRIKRGKKDKLLDKGRW